MTKHTVNQIPKAVEALDFASTLSRDTPTDVVNRALQIYAAIVRAQALGGRQAVTVENRAGGRELRLTIREP